MSKSVAGWGGGGGYSGFEVTAMIEGFFWFEVFYFGIFLVGKFWQVFLF